MNERMKEGGRGREDEFVCSVFLDEEEAGDISKSSSSSSSIFIISLSIYQKQHSTTL